MLAVSVVVFELVDVIVAETVALVDAVIVEKPVTVPVALTLPVSVAVVDRVGVTVALTDTVAVVLGVDVTDVDALGECSNKPVIVNLGGELRVVFVPSPSCAHTVD